MALCNVPRNWAPGLGRALLLRAQSSERAQSNEFPKGAEDKSMGAKNTISIWKELESGKHGHCFPRQSQQNSSGSLDGGKCKKYCAEVRVREMSPNMIYPDCLEVSVSTNSGLG